ncbi:MAG TPA: hypothetical protein VFU81_14530 [Thermomicrobiales bacterium]|nr:hypothetical protein [Thermomicrobiales bacterium]
MDDNRFDGLVKGLSDRGWRRRDALKAVVGGALGIAAARATSDEADGKKRCKKDFFTCPTNPAKCCSGECCEPIVGQGSNKFCRPKDGACCSVADGGGACPGDAPQCCAIGPRQPVGLCVPTGATCCTIESGGGWCAAGETCCLDNNVPSCCNGVTGLAAGKRHSAAIRPRRRKSAKRR